MPTLGLAIVTANALSARAKHAELQNYARWEYGTNDPSFLIVSARKTPRKAAKKRLGQRIRYWLNSFRGFASFDVRGTNDRVRD